MPRLALLLSFALLLALPVGAQEGQQSAPLPANAPSAGQQDSSAPEPLDAQSLARLRRGLAKPASKVTMDLSGAVPVFRMTVYGSRLLLPAFQDSLRQEWQPVQPGMLYHVDFLNMVTPAQARPFSAFAGAELLQVAADSMKNHYVQRGLAAGVNVVKREVRKSRQRRIKREVEEELAELKRRNEEAAKKGTSTPPKQEKPPPESPHGSSNSATSGR